MRKFDFVLFDLDGTLLNTLEDLADSVNSALANNGYPVIPTERYRMLVGKGVHNLITQALPPAQRQEEIIRKVHAEFSEIYAVNFQVKTSVYPGVLQALERISGSGIRMAVLSNKPDRFMSSIWDTYFGGIDFQGFRGKLDGVAGKPAPEGVIKLAADIGADLSNAIYVGDSSVDMETAVNSGMFACGVSWGFRTRQELEEYGAELIVDTPQELADFVVGNAVCN